MKFLIGVVVVVIGLVISVAWHELGHFLPAKAFKVPVRQFMVGFGPTIWSKQKGETEYGFKWIPLGGYIRMVGMYRPDPVKPPKKMGWAARLAADAREVSSEEMREGEDARAFYRLSVPKKLIVMLGGPTMNLIMAFGIFALIFCGLGVSVNDNSVGSVQAGGAAAAAGLEAGDKIVAWNGEPIDSAQAMTDAIKNSPGETSTATIERDGETLDIQITPAAKEATATDGSTVESGVIGIYVGGHREKMPFSLVPQATWETVSGTFGVLVKLPVSVVNTAETVVDGGARDPNGPISVVGAARASGEAFASADSWLDAIMYGLSILASLNIALWAFNLIPLLPLDGGHIAGALYEGIRRTWAKLRRRPDPGAVDTARAMPLAYGVFSVFILMTAVLVIADIVNPVKLF